MLVVQFEDFAGLTKTLVWEPLLADPDRELAQLRRQWPALPTFSHGPLEIGRLVGLRA